MNKSEKTIEKICRENRWANMDLCVNRDKNGTLDEYNKKWEDDIKKAAEDTCRRSPTLEGCKEYTKNK